MKVHRKRKHNSEFQGTPASEGRGWKAQWGRVRSLGAQRGRRTGKPGVGRRGRVKNRHVVRAVT